MLGKPHAAAVLGEFEQLVLFAALRLGAESYGAAIQREISDRTGRDVSLNAVYTTLDRLETKAFVRSWTGEPTPQRGGRRKKHYALLPAGRAAVRRSDGAFLAITAGLESELQKP